MVGLGVTGAAVARALMAHGHDVLAADDAPGPVARTAADGLGLDLGEAPAVDELAALVAASEARAAGAGAAGAPPGIRAGAGGGRAGVV